MRKTRDHSRFQLIVLLLNLKYLSSQWMLLVEIVSGIIDVVCLLYLHNLPPRIAIDR